MAMLLSGHCSSDRWTWWAASRTSRQITKKALRRSHYGSGPSRGGPGGIIAVPLSLTAYSQAGTAQVEVETAPLIAPGATLALKARLCFLRSLDISCSSSTAVAALSLGARSPLSYLSSFPGPPQNTAKGFPQLTSIVVG